MADCQSSDMQPSAGLRKRATPCDRRGRLVSRRSLDLGPTRCLLALTAVLAIVTAITPDAQAISRKQADARALSILKPEKIDDAAVILFRERRPVRKGKRIGDALPRAVAESSKRRSGKRLKKTSWLYWLDRQWGAKFQHEGVLLAIHRRSGRVLLRKQTRWWPEVNGRLPGFVGKQFRRYADPARNGKRIAYSSGVPTRKRGRRSGGSTAPGDAAQGSAIPAGSFARDCALVIVNGEDERFKYDATGMVAALRILGLPRENVVRVGTIDDFPDLDGDGSADATPVSHGRDYEQLVDKLIAARDCNDVFIYLGGHGVSKENSPKSAGVHLGSYSYTSGGKTSERHRWVTPGNLTNVFKAHPDVTFKVKVDACYSGRFIEEMPLAENPNLLIAETASSATEVSYFYTPVVKLPNGATVKDDTNNPGNADDNIRARETIVGRSTFTNGNVFGLTRFPVDSTAVNEAQAEGGSLLVAALAYAFERGFTQDFRARIGMTHPQLARQPKPEEPDPPAPTAAISSTCHHHAGPPPGQPGYSTLRVVVSGTPGASVTVNVSGPPNSFQVDDNWSDRASRTATIGEDGTVTVDFGIFSYGSYDIEAVVSSGGQQASAQATHVVDASNTCS